MMGLALGGDQVVAGFADSLQEVPAREGRSLVLKTHRGGADLDAWLSAEAAVFVLSARDPRDAALSMARRFGASLSDAVGWIGGDCRRLMRLSARAAAILRYEDRFFDHLETAVQLARLLGLDLRSEAISAIFDRYRTQSVRAFAQHLEDLPPGRVVKGGDMEFDRETQIHRSHIGDGRSGKWRDLPAPEQQRLTAYFGPFLDRFDYPR
jgi:hypothetical protein